MSSEWWPNGKPVVGDDLASDLAVFHGAPGDRSSRSDLRGRVVTGPHCRNCHRTHRDHGPDGECLAAGAYGSRWNPYLEAS